VKCVLFVSDAQSIHTRRWAEHYRNQGLSVHIASFREASIPGVQVHVLRTHGMGRLGYFLALPALRALTRSIAPDVVHAQYVTSYGFLAAFAQLHPLVITAWGTDVLISPKQSRVMRWLASYAVRHADAVTTVAQHMNAAVAELGIPVDAISAVPFGVDSQHFRPPSQPRPRDGVVRLICTRNFGPIYDVGTLVTALQLAITRGLRLKVDLVGAGPLREELLNQVLAAQLSDVVTFHGHVSPDVLANLLAQADIFVTPALSDGNNVSLNEAMACGCFPVATDIPANAQWLKDGQNGLLYPPGDADALATCITRAAGDVAWRERVGQTNREIVEQRADWRVCVARMDEIYASAIQRHHARSLT
jgi:L-malate glycosyltransferase